MRFRFIDAERASFPVMVMCRVLRIAALIGGALIGCRFTGADTAGLDLQGVALEDTELP